MKWQVRNFTSCSQDEREGNYEYESCDIFHCKANIEAGWHKSLKVFYFSLIFIILMFYLLLWYVYITSPPPKVGGHLKNINKWKFEFDSSWIIFVLFSPEDIS